jgi:hypothetical protein
MNSGLAIQAGRDILALWLVRHGSRLDAQVERALGTLFGAPASAQGSFRGRVRHFQRIGLVEVTPGRGRRIPYTRVQAAKWMVALVLAELGVDPIVIVKSIQQERTQLREPSSSRNPGPHSPRLGGPVAPCDQFDWTRGRARRSAGLRSKRLR